jgi:hypothetical protein
VIPYECDELVLHRTLAVEIKAVRASYVKQGRSPNQFGYSQAQALLALGFPYAAVVHLVVSDESPRSAWRNMGLARVLDREGNAEMLPPAAIDCLPIDLVNRSLGRLVSGAPPGLGLVACYIGGTIVSIPGFGTGKVVWQPLCRPAKWNENQSDQLLRRVANLVEESPSSFLDNPRYDPVREER